MNRSLRVKLVQRVWCCLLLTLLVPIWHPVESHGDETNSNTSSAHCSLNSHFEMKLDDAMPLTGPRHGREFSSRNYPEFHAIEWQVRYSNPAIKEGSQDDPKSNPIGQIDRLHSADFVIQFPTKKPIVLDWSQGSHTSHEDFRPFRERPEVGATLKFESYGGRSSDGVMPYFRLSTEDGGVVVAVGWAGDWTACFQRISADEVRVQLGLRHGPFATPDSEKVRLPSVLLMSYKGSVDFGRNQFRRLMRKHFSPDDLPEEELMPLAASVHGIFGFDATTETGLIELANRVESVRLPLDVFWLDAGWNTGGFPKGQGNLVHDTTRFPSGLKPVGDVVAKTGMKFLVWFEPERAMKGTDIPRLFPKSILAPTSTPPEVRYLENDGFLQVDLGDRETWTRTVDGISKQISDAQIKIYRQDFNSYPRYFWNSAGEQKAALSEVRHIDALYRLWDELRKRHPGLLIDNCASGGRRLDFESMRRSVVLWRSDSCWDSDRYPRNVQCMALGLSEWIPYHGLGSVATDSVSLRSGMGTCSSFAIDYRDDQAVENLRKHLTEYRQIRQVFARDFYPLSEWTDQTTEWLVYQFDDPESGSGIVQAFRGKNEKPSSMRIQLKGLQPTLRYSVRDWDRAGEKIEMTGAELMEVGLELKRDEKPQAVVIEYCRVQ